MQKLEYCIELAIVSVDIDQIIVMRLPLHLYHVCYHFTFYELRQRRKRTEMEKTN